MNNIEKFEKIKQLQRLKVEYHKRNMSLTVRRYTSLSEGNGLDRVLKISKLVYKVYRLFKK